MSRIDDLIAEHCPGGVEFKRLGDIVRIRNGKDHKKLGEGEVPVFGSGGVMRYADTYAYDQPSVLIPRKGSLGNLFYVDVPFWTVDTIFYTEIDHTQVLPKFLYYFLTTVGLGEMNQAAGVPSQTQSVLNQLKIPVPPPEVQREIVEILDKMETLKAELGAELEARSRQYAYYRDSLIAFPDRETVRWAALTEIGTLYNGLTGKSKIDFQQGYARYVPYMTVFGNLSIRGLSEDRVRIGVNEHQNRVRFGDILFTASSESAAEVGMSSAVTVEPGETTFLNSFCFGFRPHDPQELDPEFAKHLFRSSIMRRQIIKTANGVTRINISKERFRLIELPIPEPAEQKRIAQLLDAFESLVNDLSVGLPAEIKARREQYEYYRDRLLTFRELEL